MMISCIQCVIRYDDFLHIIRYDVFLYIIRCDVFLYIIRYDVFLHFIKCATGVKLRGREDITIAIWNVRTLRAAGKLDNFCMRWTDTSGASLDCMR